MTNFNVINIALDTIMSHDIIPIAMIWYVVDFAVGIIFRFFSNMLPDYYN